MNGKKASISKHLYKDIITAFEKHENVENSQQMKAYMRGQFEYYGIKTPQRRELSKPFIKEIKKWDKNAVLELIRLLWQQSYRELHHLALDLLLKVSKKHLSEKNDIDFLEWLIIHNSWWDTVDFIAPKLMKTYFEKFPKERNKKVDEWITSGNLWLQRSAILIHLKTKEKVDLPYLFDTILRLTGTNEFFINKAIGWVLREHAKKHPEKIISFVKKHQGEMSKLSKQEALKHFPEVYKEIV